jgi:hypothetical protein
MESNQSNQPKGIFGIIVLVVVVLVISGTINYFVKNSNGLNSSDSREIKASDEQNYSNSTDIEKLESNTPSNEKSSENSMKGTRYENDPEGHNYQDLIEDPNNSEQVNSRHEDRFIICTNCNGSKSINKDCHFCYGTGWDTHNKHSCEFCKGKGTERAKCEVCMGIGRVKEYEYK